MTDFLRGLLGLLPPLARPTPVPPAASVMVAPAPAGFTYACRACDVYGYIAAADARVCWACGTADSLERRQ